MLAAINGPVEVQRRDELPEEATIDVVVRPASGVGGDLHTHRSFKWAMLTSKRGARAPP